LVTKLPTRNEVGLSLLPYKYIGSIKKGEFKMANFFQGLIDKITGHGSNPNTANLDISHVAAAAAATADPRVEVAQREAAEAEAKKQAEAAQQNIGTGGYEPPSQSAPVADASPSPETVASNDFLNAWQEKADAAAAAAKEIADAADQFEIIKEHTLTYDDTLSGLALHFYGHATPEYWGLIILANKNTIGDKVKDYTPGKVIKIPKLPDEMKKKK
jgi:nucleoid-associated protein YgaU